MWCVGGIANSDDCVRGLLRFKRGRLRLGPQRVGGLPAVRSSFPAVSAARVVWALVFGMSVAAHPLSGAAAEPGYLFGAERSAQSDAFAQVGIDGWLREAVEQAPADMQLGNDVDSSARLLAQARASDARGDIDTAPRSHVVKSVGQRRRAIVHDCHALRLEVDHYNDAHPEEEPIQLLLDFEEDVEEMLVAAGLGDAAA